MKRLGMILTFILLSFSIKGQQSIVAVSTYDFGYLQPLQVMHNDVALKNMPRIKNITLPNDLFTSIYRKGSVERTINIYGQSLIIESAEVQNNGRIHLILRREDGRDFYNLYPMVKAELIRENINNTKPIPSL